MANANSTVNLAEIDQFRALNRALSAYQELVTAWVQKVAADGPPTDISAFLAGLDLIFEPILDGYNGLYSKFDDYRLSPGA